MQVSFLASLAIATTSSLVASAAPTIPDSPPPGWREDAYSFSFSSEYFSSSSNFNDGRGSYSSLPNGNNFTSFENRGLIRYATNDQWAIFGATGFTQSHAVDNTASLDKTNGTFTDVSLGTDYLMRRRWMNVVSELQVSWPLDTNDTTRTTPLTNDGVPTIRLGAFLFKRYQTFRLESYLGFYAPTSDLAKRFVYSLLGEAALFSTFTVGGGIDGYESVLADGQTSTTRANLIANTDAGDARFAAWNPAVTEARLWLGLRPDRGFAIRLGYLKTINGVRAANGQSLLLSLSLNTPGLRERFDNRDTNRTTTTPVPSPVTAPVSQPETDSRADTPAALSPTATDEFIPESGTTEKKIDETEKMIEKVE